MNGKNEAKDRSVAASEIINSIITTGNNSPVFVGRYERLRDAVIQPDEVFRRVHIESFVGRRWLIEQIDSILRENNCGYLVLEAHAGLGKTAFLAWLVKERNYVHHFVELAPGQEGIERGLKNLAAQLIVAYELSADEVIPYSATRPDYLYRLLSKATEKRHPKEKIVIVVDALDEAGTPPNQNVLGLPKVLPENVFFIVSMRPVQVGLQSDRFTTPRWPLKILAESDENLQDLRSFLKASAVWPKIAMALEESEYTTEDFIDTLMKKSQGLWIYLHFVIPEIERGERSPLDLDTLPEGLQEYYANYWSRWRDSEKWYDLYLPILTVLAAAQEFSTLDRILDWSEIEAQGGERSRLRSILKEQWRPFLAVSGEGKQEKYRFYHATVREFFEGKVELNGLLQPEIDLMNELSEATEERHRMIAERYLATWGGLEKGLPYLETKKNEDDGYGLRYLAAHLEASGQDVKLHYLLNLETCQERNLWYAAKEAGGDTTGYLNDITRAWLLAEKGYDPEDIERNGRSIGLQNRYALIFASINSLSGNIPPELLLALVENGIWSKEEGLAHARHVPDLNRRATILTELSSLVKEPIFLEEALASARKIQNKVAHDGALAEIAANLQDAQEALAITREIQNEGWRTKALAKIAAKLQDDQEALAATIEIQDEWQRARALSKRMYYVGNFEDALTIVQEIQAERWCARALAEIAANLQNAQKKDVLDNALASAREIQDGRLRASALTEIAPHLQDGQKKYALDEALAAAREIQEGRPRASALAEIAPYLQDSQKKYALDEALAIAREIQDEESRDSALEEIAPNLLDSQEALAVTREILNEGKRARALATIAPNLQNAQEALTVAREMLDGGWRARTLTVITFYLPDAQKRDVLDEALAAARKIQDGWQRASVLAKIAPNLLDVQKRDVLNEALASAQEIQDEDSRASVLAEIAPYLPDVQKRDVLDEALASAQEIQDEGSRASAMAEITFYLPDAQKRDVLNEVLAVAREMQDERWRDRVLAKIAPNLLDAQQALAVVREIQDEESRDSALEEIAPNLLDSQEALAVTREILNEGKRARALATIAPNLQNAQEALTVAREMLDGGWRARTLTEIAPNLPDAQKRDVLNEALALAREIQDGWQRDSALEEIAPNLQEAQDALTVAQEIQNEGKRSRALATIAPNLQNAQEALTVAREMLDDGWRARTLTEIAPNLPDAQKRDLLEEALAVARKIKDGWWRDSALAKIAPNLQDAQDALTVAQEIQNGRLRASALAEIAPHLQDGQKKYALDEALAAAREIQDGRPRASALAEIALNLPDVQKRDVLDEALALAREIQDEWWRASALGEVILSLLAQQNLIYFSLWPPTIHDLSSRRRADLLSDFSSLAPLVARLGGDDALLETVRAIKDVGRWWP